MQHRIFSDAESNLNLDLGLTAKKLEKSIFCKICKKNFVSISGWICM